jgi:hypothetical protein
MAAALDTSGWVPLGRDKIHFDDLPDFEQGYTAAALSACGLKTPWGAGYDVVRKVGFYDLAEEAIALILKDCEAIRNRSGDGYCARIHGAEAWCVRQLGGMADFPPLSVTLDDEGKVQLRAVDDAT